MDRPVRLTDTQEPLISVVMPAYNTADYLTFALHNVVKDQFGDMPSGSWEVIVVDDGSTDNTYLTAKPWEKEYPGAVKVLHTENRGVSAARNLGLSEARGKFVYFIDSDDILLRGSLPALCDKALREDADVVKFVYRDISTPEYRSMQANVAPANLAEEDYSLHSAGSFIALTNGLTGPPSHHATFETMYRRQFLADNGLAFSEGFAVGEDIIFTWEALLCNPRVLYADRALYLYHHRADSAIRSTDTDHLRKTGHAYARYLNKMLTISRKLSSMGLASDRVMQGLASNYRYGYNRMLTDMIIAGEPLRNIYRTMLDISRNGGDVHPGRPRFDKTTRRSASPRQKLRRWVTAYVLASMIATRFHSTK